MLSTLASSVLDDPSLPPQKITGPKKASAPPTPPPASSLGKAFPAASLGGIRPCPCLCGHGSASRAPIAPSPCLGSSSRGRGSGVAADAGAASHPAQPLCGSAFYTSP